MYYESVCVPCCEESAGILRVDQQRPARAHGSFSSTTHPQSLSSSQLQLSASVNPFHSIVVLSVCSSVVCPSRHCYHCLLTLNRNDRASPVVVGFFIAITDYNDVYGLLGIFLGSHRILFSSWSTVLHFISLTAPCPCWFKHSVSDLSTDSPFSLDGHHLFFSLRTKS